MSCFVDRIGLNEQEREGKRWWDDVSLNNTNRGESVKEKREILSCFVCKIQLKGQKREGGKKEGKKWNDTKKQLSFFFERRKRRELFFATLFSHYFFFPLLFFSYRENVEWTKKFNERISHLLNQRFRGNEFSKKNFRLTAGQRKLK